VNYPSRLKLTIVHKNKLKAFMRNTNNKKAEGRTFEDIANEHGVSSRSVQRWTYKASKLRMGLYHRNPIHFLPFAPSGFIGILRDSATDLIFIAYTLHSTLPSPQMGIPRTLDDIAIISNTKRKSIAKCYGQILQNALQGLQIRSI
jgi:transcription initiation factor TFIIIB Brf1 subunit/transcription initiation factor TFIIB